MWEPDTLLAVTVWGEARGEDIIGKLAVAHVILNRLKSRNLLPADLAKVVLKPWQFSCWNQNDPNASKMGYPIKHSNAVVWDACATIAALALGGLTVDPTGGASHYCTKPLWAVPSDPSHKRWHDNEEIVQGRTVKTAELGNHVFAKAA